LLSRSLITKSSQLLKENLLTTKMLLLKSQSKHQLILPRSRKPSPKLSSQSRLRSKSRRQWRGVKMLPRQRRSLLRKNLLKKRPQLRKRLLLKRNPLLPKSEPFARLTGTT
jgi:hypothetical protein